MSAFLKIDRCTCCSEELPWEWIPPVPLGTKTLAGTGVWRSTLTDGLCGRCLEQARQAKREHERAETLRQQFVRLVGGERPYREFTFERYRVNPRNDAAYAQAISFDPIRENLFLWGPSGVGKTHLAIAILRRFFSRGPAVFLTPGQLIRKVRMKSPDEEQRVVDECVHAPLLVLDSLSNQPETPFGRQILQEILDGRRNRDRGGLVVTSLCSPDVLSRRSGDPVIAVRLTAMCRVIEVRA